MRPLTAIFVSFGALLGAEAATGQPATSIHPQTYSPTQANTPVPNLARVLRIAAAREKVAIKALNWTGGGVMTARFTFENKNDFEVKDLTVMCDFYAASGTMVGNTKIQTIFIKLPKLARTTSPSINFGFIHQQAHAAKCRLSDLALLSP